MFNSYNSTYRGGDVSNTLKINACSGGIYKTYKESWFIRFNLKSETANILFKPYDNKLITSVEKKEYSFEPVYGDKYYYNKNKEKVIILQMIICGDMEVIAEVIKENDFNKYFQKEETNE